MSDTSTTPEDGQSEGNLRAFVGAPADGFSLYAGCGWTAMDRSLQAYVRSFTIVAPDQETAEREVLRILRQDRPPWDGWHGHTVLMTKIDRSTVEEWLETITS